MANYFYTDSDGNVLQAAVPSNKDIDEVATETVGAGNYWVKEPDDCPDAHFRDAWSMDDEGNISINMTKAKELHRNDLRNERQSKWPDLDVAFMRAVEQSDTMQQATIAAKKQALRDVTADPAIDAASTAEELKAVRPAILDE